MKLDEMRSFRFSKHFCSRFVQRFGSKYGLTEQSPDSDVKLRLFRILSESVDVLPSDPSYSYYCETRYGNTKMMKGCGIVFFIRDNVITTCIAASSSAFEKKDSVLNKSIEPKLFSLGEIITS